LPESRPQGRKPKETMKKYLIHIALAGKDQARNRTLITKSAKTLQTLSNGQCITAYQRRQWPG
jgi:hypothetical protein